MIKVLNLYAGIGGNRELWDGVEVTAIEHDPAIAGVYKERFPNDKVVVFDAGLYLQEHYQEFDFIWSSPPCQSHSSIRHFEVVKQNQDPILPDMALYSHIVFLQTYAAKHQKWVVENVYPYYKPLIPPQRLGRHCVWANFKIHKQEFETDSIQNATIGGLEARFNVSLADSGIENKRQVLRNCVDPLVGLELFDAAFNTKQRALAL